MSNFVYLKVPNVEDFRDFLISQGVHEYAVVQRRIGGNIVTYYFRLTAKLPQRQEIAICDIPYWKGMQLDLEDKIEVVNKKKDEVWESISKTMTSGTISEPTGAATKVAFQMHDIDGEYSMSAMEG